MNVLNMAAGAVMPRGISLNPGSLAADLLNTARVGVGHGNSHQLAEVETALSAMAQNDPITAKAVRASIMDALSPLEQGEMLRLSCGGGKQGATVEMGPMEDAPPAQPSESRDQLNIGNVLLSEAKSGPDGTRALPFFLEAERLGTPQALKDAALSSIAVYNYEGISAGGIRRNDIDASGQMKPIAGAQGELLAHVAKDMGVPDSDTAKAMRTGYAALASDAAMPAQIRQDAAQVVQLLDANTAAWDKYVVSPYRPNVSWQTEHPSSATVRSEMSKSGIGQITSTVVGKQIETFAKAAIETGASADDVKYITYMGKGVAGLGSVIAFKDLRDEGFTVPASIAGAVANEASGNAIIWSGAAMGTALEPGGGTVVGGVVFWVGDTALGISDAAGRLAAQQFDLQINGKPIAP